MIAHLCSAFRCARAGQPGELGAAREGFVRAAATVACDADQPVRIAVACPVWHVDGRPIYEEKLTDGPTRGNPRRVAARESGSFSMALVGANVAAIEFAPDATAADFGRWLDAVVPTADQRARSRSPNGPGSVTSGLGPGATHAANTTSGSSQDFADRLWAATMPTVRCRWQGERAEGQPGVGTLARALDGIAGKQDPTPPTQLPEPDLARTALEALAMLPDRLPDARSRVLDALLRSLRVAMRQYRLRAAMQILNLAERSPHLAPTESAGLLRVLGEFTTVGWLERFIEEAEPAELAAVGTMLLRVPPETLAGLLTSRTLLTHPTLRPALETLCQLCPEPFEEALQDEDSGIVGACLGIRLAGGQPLAAESVDRALQRLDSIRKRQLLAIPTAVGNDAVLAGCVLPPRCDADTLTLRRACELVPDPAGPRTVAALFDCLMWTAPGQQPTRDPQRTLRPVAQALARQRAPSVLDELELVLCAGGPAAELLAAALARATTAESRTLLERCAKSGSPAARARCAAALGIRVVGRQQPLAAPKRLDQRATDRTPVRRKPE